MNVKFLISKMSLIKPKLLRFLKDKVKYTRYFLTAVTTFDAAHRLSNYKGKCSHLHGHTYKIKITVSSSQLNNWGAVMDFVDLKNVMKDNIDVKYDHKTILWAGDNENQILGRVMDKNWVCWMNSNPTAENMARDIFQELAAVLKIRYKDIKLELVVVYETPTNCARYTEEK